MIVKMLHAEEFSLYTKCGWETFSFASSGQKKLFLVLPIFHFPSWWCPEKNIFLSLITITSSELNSLILKFCLWLLLLYFHLSHLMKMGRSYTWCGDWKRKFCDKRLEKNKFLLAVYEQRNRIDIYICSSKNRLTSSGFLDLFLCVIVDCYVDVGYVRIWRVNICRTILFLKGSGAPS